MTKQGSQTSNKTPSARDQRLKQALKANISRRKAQAKARAQASDAKHKMERDDE